MAIAKVLALVVWYGVAIRILYYVSKNSVVEFNLAIVEVDRQTAKFNSDKFPGYT